MIQLIVGNKGVECYELIGWEDQIGNPVSRRPFTEMFLEEKQGELKDMIK